MTLAFYFLRTSFNHLRRGGQRVLVALLCISFGVMSLIAMLLLANALEKMLLIEPRQIIGADLSASRVLEDGLLPEHIQQLEQLRASGKIEQYTLVAYSSSIAFRRPDSGELHIPGSGLGIDPAVYPLAGQLKVGQPGNVGPETLLQETGDVLVTRDLAITYGLTVGDALILTDLQVGAPLAGRVRGILIDTPNHQGSKLYYNAASAEALAGGELTWNTLLALAPQPGTLNDSLNASGWSSFLASDLADSEAATRRLLTTALNGAGMLGLMVGGIGIANTMQVLLNRRRKEVAVWKTLGYRSSELQILFACEALLLGAAGSLLGAGLGLLVSRLLVNLFSRTTTLLVEWQPAPVPVITGVAVGMATTLIFALFAIVLASRVAPLGLLRSEALCATRLPWVPAIGLGLALAAPLLAVTSLVMGSLAGGLVMLMVIAAGLVGLGGLLSGLVWLSTHLLPGLLMARLPLVNLARSNLRRRGWGLVFAMIALFVSVVALALSAVVTDNARRAMSDRAIVLTGDNMMVLGPLAQEPAIRAALGGQPLEHLTSGYLTPVQAVIVEGVADAPVAALLIGRPNGEGEPSDYEINGAAWGSQPGGVYVEAFSGIEAGSRVTVTALDGSQHHFSVAGWYAVDFVGYGPRPAPGLLLPVDQSLAVASPATVQIFARVPPGQLQATVTRLGQVLPGATTINLLAYATRFTRQYHNLFIFAVAMAGLALLAGVLLLANSVSLAMLDRRYEMGVFKAMGYSRRHLLVTLMVEYGLAAFIAGAAGLAVVRAYLWLMARANPLAGQLLVMSPVSAGLIGAACLGLTLLTVVLATWRPVQVSPVVVLNDRD